MLEDRESRRNFLQKLATLMCWQLMAEQVSKLPCRAQEPAARQLPFKVSAWTGDDFSIGHQLRNGKLPEFPNAAERTVDFVIVGGGVAGLTAAHALKDHDFVLLEQYGAAGGHARGGSFRGVDYSWGSAYTGTTDDTSSKLFADLGIKPVKLEASRNAWYWQEKWFSGVSSAADNELFKQFNKLIAEARSATGKIQWGEGRQYSPDFLRLDTTPFASCFKDYNLQFASLIDSYCRSAFCGGIDQISALAGYALLADLDEPIHVFKGGNSAIARALVASIESTGKNRIFTDTFVWKVEVQDNGASIVYSTADGTCHRIQCRHAIVATSPMVAARQLSHVEDSLRGQLLMFKFGSYLVANCLTKKKLFNGAYDSYVGQPFTFADLIVAETPYMAVGEYKPSMGSVLTVYQPYPAGSAGRSLLMAGDRENFAREISSQLETLVTGLCSELDEMVLTRWGHALAIVAPGYFSRLQKIKPLQERFSLAHSTITGGPSVNAAIRGGELAAKNALKAPTKVSMLVEKDFGPH